MRKVIADCYNNDMRLQVDAGTGDKPVLWITIRAKDGLCFGVTEATQLRDALSEYRDMRWIERI